MLREFTNSLTRWDTLLFHRIFGWGDKRILNCSFRIISWSANGCLYPFIGLYVHLTFGAATSKPLLLSAALAFPLERLLYHFLKQSMKRDRPYERIVDVHFRVRPPDRFSFPSGHTASAFLMMALLSNTFPGFTSSDVLLGSFSRCCARLSRCPLSDGCACRGTPWCRHSTDRYVVYYVT